MSCDSILAANEQEWQPALHHEFLGAGATGSIQEAAFNHWLAQDHQFVISFREFADHVLSQAPAADRELLEDELRWFQVRTLAASASAVPRHT